MNNIKDLVSKRFSRLIVISITDKRTKSRNVIWLCKCDCGKEKLVDSNTLNKGKTKSCGCLKKETKPNFKHGLSYTKQYMNDANRKSVYGIDSKEFNDMREKQNNSCAICSISEIKLSKSLCVDHNHLTGTVRGLLCDRCNLLLGYANDDTAILQKTIDYLKSEFK